MRARTFAHQLLLALLLARFAGAQTSQFLFDPNGNLSIEMAAALFPPQITGQPQMQVVQTNEFASFSVVVADPRSLTYQWQFNGSDLPGKTGVSLQIDHASPSDEGPYRVVLSNPSGSVTSAPAMLWIDNDRDFMGDSWELAHFGNLNQNANSDFDHDGVSNIREFRDGTDPTDPNSARYRLTVIREGGAVLKNPDQTLYDKGQIVTLTVTASSNELFHAWLGDVVSRDNPVTLVMTNDKTVFARFTPIAFTWTSPASGNWEDAANWTPQLAPGVNDSVLINSAVTVTLTTNADCADVTLGNFFTTLTGTGILTVRANLFWSEGSMTGIGKTILETNAVLNIMPATGFVSLNSRTLENGGTILCGAGLVGIGNGAVITNRPGGLFRAENAAFAHLGGGIANGRFDNAGTFLKPTNTAPLSIDPGLSLNNYGTVRIETNILICNGGLINNGTITLLPATTNQIFVGGSGTGIFDVPPGSLVEWDSGTFTLNSGAQLNGAGLYRISGSSTIAVNGSTTVSNLDMVSASSTLGGTGVLTIANTMNWTAGTMIGGGTTLIGPSATLNLGSVSLTGRTLENGGTVLWNGTGLILSAAVITNRSGALFDSQNDVAPFFAGIACRFDNVGTFRKSAGAGTTTLPSGVSFNNFGAVDVQTGRLVLAGGGSANGSFNVSPISQLEWPSGGFTLNPGAQLNGVGLYKVSGATVFDNTSLSVSNLDLAAGTLDGTGILTIAGTMNWTGGTMAGTGRTLVVPGAALNLPGSTTVFLSRTIENAGTFLWTGVGNLGMGVITNRPGALFDVRSSAAFSFFAPNPRFDNAGTFRKSTSTGTTTMNPNFTNYYGTVEIQAGTLLCNGSFANSGAVNLSAGTTSRLGGGGMSTGPFDSPATALTEWTGGTFTLSSGAQLNGAGLYKVNGATLISGINLAVQNMDLAIGILDGAGIVTISNAMNWTGGSMSGSGRTLIAPAATLNLNNPSQISLTTRTLENAGTVLWTGAGGIGLIGAAITNRPVALFHAQNAATIGSISTTRFDNAGTFRKSVNPGTTTLNANFNNSGTLEIQTGTFSSGSPFVNNGAINLSAGATARLGSGGSSSGRFDAPASALVEWTVGNFTLSTGAQLNGVGQYRINGGSLVANTNLTVENLDLNTGSLDGSSTVTMAHTMNWTGGSMSGTGRTIISPSATLNINSPSPGGLSISRTLENGGTTTWTGAGNISMAGSTITNRAGALFHVQNSAAFVGTTRFDNAGTFRKSTSPGTTVIPNNVAFNNFGTVDLHSGILLANGGFLSSPNALLNCSLGGTNAGTGYGQLQVPGAVTLNGALSVDLINGFVPRSNSTFTLVTAGSRNGSFANFTYPSNAVTMQLSNTANSAIVRATDIFIAPQPAPVAAGLISWWRAEGNAMDSIGTNHGVLTNGATFTAGQVGQAFAFDGADDYAQVSDSQTLRPVSVTIEAWVKFFATNGTRIVLVKPLGNNTTFDSYGLALQDGAVLAAICDNAGFGPFLTGPANTVTGAWYHLVYTFDDTSKQQVLYVNGAPVASGTANKTISYDTHPVLLGVDLENGVLSFFHSGLIDEASIYNRALTWDEIASIYNAGSLGKLFAPPRPLLSQPELAGSNIKLTWTALSNLTYRIEFNPNLGPSNWAALPGDVVGISNTASKLDPLTSSNRFYRIRVLP
jgi:hypothetical protein